jgi:spore coat polysaccharide biosynthesis protein SpsF
MIIAVIQARTESKRLPKKAILKIGAETLIGSVINRVKKVKKVKKIILATTNSITDNKLAKIALAKKILVFRGSKNDVVNRFYNATKKIKPYAILRITGDCPLISPKILDQLIDIFKKNKADYASTSKRFAHGLDAEIFTFDLLKKINKKIKSKSDKEHITQLMLKNKRIKKVTLYNKLNESKFRITIDTKKDFFFIKKIVAYFEYKKITDYEFKDIKKYLNKNLNLLKINKDVKSKRGLITK